jgi:predicted Zn-dependent protease
VTTHSEVLPDVKPSPMIIAGKQDQDLEYKVRVEFVFSADDVKAYPELFKAFTGAIQEWANVLPIEAVIIVPKDDVSVVDIRNDRRGVTMVIFTRNIPSKDKENNLGVWFYSTATINLDLNDIYPNETFDIDLARAVSLHELGHMFGLPHIGNSGDMNIQAGDLIIKSGAENMMMNPELPADAKSVVISKMEAEYARRYILTVFSQNL